DQMVDQTLSGHDTIGKTKIDRLRGSDHQPNPKVRKIFDTTPVDSISLVSAGKCAMTWYQTRSET
ncbi:hypothetical protein AAFN47_19575, partial [Hoeflea sp. CAU 1731]